MLFNDFFQILKFYSVAWFGKTTMTGKRKDMEGGGRGVFEGTLLAFSSKDWDKQRKILVRIASSSVEILTAHLPNTFCSVPSGHLCGSKPHLLIGTLGHIGFCCGSFPRFKLTFIWCWGMACVKAYISFVLLFLLYWSGPQATVPFIHNVLLWSLLPPPPTNSEFIVVF